MRIDKITPEQTARFAEWTRKWIEIGLSTEPADFDRATAAALKAYKLANLGKPMVILRMGSPYGAALGGAIAWMMLRELFGSQVESQVWSQVWSQVRSQVESQVRSQVRSQVESQVWSQVESQVRSQVRSQVESQVESQVWSQVGSQVRSQVESQVESQVGSQVRSQVRSQVESQVWSQVESQVWSQVGSQVRSLYADNNRGGAFWASWCAYVSFFRDAMGWADPVLERFEIDEALTQSCGWTWWHENVLAISDRPERLHRDEAGRLHCETGPSISYRDGWALHHWHGVPVPAIAVEQPHLLAIKDVQAEKSEEVRRVLIERFGWERFLRESKAKIAHRRFNERDQQWEELYRLDDGTQRVLLSDPSTGRRYALGVPREVANCEQAQAFLSHGLDKFAVHRS